MVKIAAVVITYFPDIKDTIANIGLYIHHVDKLIVWDNNTAAEGDKFRPEYEAYADKIEFMGTGKNEGIAFALNRCIEWATGNGYTHLLTMDQDSSFVDFSKFQDIIRNMDDNSILAFCPNVNNLYSLVCNQPFEVVECITSGTVYVLENVKKVGPFREDYFIDAVDLEYCYRGIVMGYKTVVIPSANLIQRFGNPLKNVLGFTPINYSAFRSYFIIRNHLLLWREYPSLFNKRSFLITEQIIKRVVKIILGEDHKAKKIAAIMKGFRDGLLFPVKKIKKQEEK